MSVLPTPLHDLWQHSLTDVVAIALTAKDCDFVPSYTSQIGGIGYMPRGFVYPTDKSGKPMALLLQLNFAQISPYHDGSILPQQGILQVYIGNDGVLGANTYRAFFGKIRVFR